MTIQPSTMWPAVPLLFGADVAAGIDTALRDPHTWAEVQTRLGSVGSQVLRRMHAEVAAVAADFTDLDLARLLMTGWAKHRQLRVAAQRSLTNGTVVPVTLATHDIKLTQHPSIEVLLGPHHLLTIDCEFATVLTIEGLRAIVRAGALREVHSGACTITTSFALEGVQLARYEFKRHPIAHIPLGPGIPLGASERHAW